MQPGRACMCAPRCVKECGLNAAQWGEKNPEELIYCSSKYIGTGGARAAIKPNNTPTTLCVR